jgi:hypothetical protein
MCDDLRCNALVFTPDTCIMCMKSCTANCRKACNDGKPKRTRAPKRKRVAKMPKALPKLTREHIWRIARAGERLSGIPADITALELAKRFK